MDIQDLVPLLSDYRILAGLAIIAVILQRVLTYPLTRWRTVSLNKAHGCQAAPRWPTRDPFLGLDFVLRMRGLVQRRELLRHVPGMFEQAVASRSGDSGSGVWCAEMNMAGRRVLWLAEPEMLKTVLQTKFKDWRIGDSRRDTITPIFGPMIIVAEGELWHETRGVMRPSFARKQVCDLELLDTHVGRLLERLPRKSDEEVDLKPLFFDLSMDYSTEFLFGFSTNNLAAERDAEGQAFAEAIDRLQNSVITQQFLGKLGSFFFGESYKKDRDLVRRTIDGYIQKTEKALSSRTADEKAEAREKYNVMEEMMTAWPTQPERVQGEATALLLAGRDTTAATLTNLFFYLSRQPETWRKLRAECLAAPAEPTHEELRALHYLHDCVRECLRMVNATLDLARTANADTILPVGGGPDGKSPLFVEKGTHVQLWIYAAQHRKDIWGEDAEVFRPERWEDDSHFPAFSFLPFGGGPRICLGQQLAISETMYTTFRIAREFETITATDPRPWTESLAIGTTSYYGAKVKLAKA